MHFEYEIDPNDFVASQVLYRKLSLPGRRTRPYENAIAWIVVGGFFIAVAWNDKTFTWAPGLLALIGVWWIYAGLVHLFPAKYFRRKYRETEFWGKRFHAEVTESGFEVIGELCSWHVLWNGVKLMGESNSVFVFYSANTVFGFGKRFLSEAQQEELRRLSGIEVRL
jgi:non-ribosomal peptide synthetase component F